MTMENKEAIQPIEEDELEGITGGEEVILPYSLCFDCGKLYSSELPQCPFCHPET